MDDRTLQFALFLGIAAALWVLVNVGMEIARRLSLQWRAHHQVQSAGVPVEVMPRRHD